MQRAFDRLTRYLAIFAMICVIPPAFADANPSPSVTVESGTLQGIRFGSSEEAAAFLGIPYAAAPVGDLRWKPPQPAGRWKGARSAQRFGAACPQLPAKWFPYIGWDEDCLYLNVWTPRLTAAAKLPVLVYFHGGSNTQGYGHMTPLGPVFAPFGLVVVSVNYRLGPFGFLAHPALTAESPRHSSGNYGLLDQLQALHWIRENISQFGGDPARVTVMGQSSGAVDVCLLMASPLVAGLFQRAILESGDCQSVLNEDIRAPIPYNSIHGTGEAVGERLAADLGAKGSDILRKLRSIPAVDILKTWSDDRSIHFDAIVDGWIVPEQPATIFAEGRQMRIPVLVGSNADEATVFGHNNIKTVDQYKEYLRQDVQDYAAREFEIYPVRSDADVPAQYVHLESDMFAYGAYSMAQATERTGQKAYLYDFTYVETGKRASLGAYHGEELKFLSDAFPDDWEHGPDDRKLGQAMRAYWIQFAKTGDPNAPGLPYWPAQRQDSNDCFELGRKLGLQQISNRIRHLQDIMHEVLHAREMAGQSHSLHKN